MPPMTLHLVHPLIAVACLVPPFWLARRLSRRLLPGADSLQTLMAALLMAFALVAGTGGLLGWCGCFSLFGFGFVALATLIAAVLLGRCERPRSGGEDPAWPAAPAWMRFVGLLALAIVAGAVGARLAQPVVEYDALTYHLHFPAQWLNAGRIFLIDTPYGDAAPAYAPAWGEVWFGWLMAPWRGAVTNLTQFKLSGVDAVAKIGQLPFLGLAIAALLWLGRSLGGRSAAVYWPALLFCFVPWAGRQASAPAVDLFMASFFLSSLAWSQDYRMSGRRAAAALAGLSLGLAFGVKAVVPAYAPLIALPFLVFAAGRRDGRALFAWLLPLLAFGLPWYLRNWALTGNPLFPLDVSAFSRHLFAGAYTRQAMLQSAFHVPGPGAALAVATHACGLWLAPLGLAGIVAGMVAAWRQPAWRPFAWIAPVALVWHFLFVPFSSQDRFLLWVVALAFLPLAAWPERGPWPKVLAAAALAGIGLTLIGPGTDFSLGLLPVRARGLLSGEGWGVGLLVFAVAALVLWIGRWRGAGSPTPWVLAFALAATLATIFASPHGGAFVKTEISTFGDLPLAGYLPIWRERGQVVAYAGTNRPYYLAGRDGTNRVVSVPSDGCLDCRLHDYVRRLRKGGLLDRSREKAPWREHNPSYEAWRAALEAAGVTMFFAEKLAATEAVYLAHEPDGFPPECAWAREHPERFSRLAAGPDFELYHFRPQP